MSEIVDQSISQRANGAAEGTPGTRRCATAILMTAAIVIAGSQPAAAAEKRTALRVCAPPFNLPMSNRQGEGYENKIAELFAHKLELPLEFEWFPQRIGFIRNTLRNDNTPDGKHKCDIVMGVIENFELAATTKPYMHSAWSLVYVRGRGLDFIKSQDDLKNLTPEQKSIFRIGVWDKGPAPDWFYHRGLMEYSTPYQIMHGDTERNPGKIIEDDLVNDKINLTIVWGPIAGFYAKRIKDHDIAVIPMRNELRVNFDFQIAMAVRYGESEWKDQVNNLITDNQAEIDAILDEYGVPRLPVVESTRNEDD
jgi:quinoprotein dehydrogenase-associated probable ABC transporter substrate-binding protein